MSVALPCRRGVDAARARLRRLSRRHRGIGAFVLALLPACADGQEYQFAGFSRDPRPDVATVALPDLSNNGTPFEFRAEPGHVLVVYFGYTNCPDVCPTTLADLRAALNRMGDEADRVVLAMATVDPDRDLAVLAEYVQSFVPDAHALGTGDDALLASAAAPFGAAYTVTLDDDGAVEVGHTANLYVVDEHGQLVLTWPFGTTSEELANDLEHLLDV